MSRVAPTTGDLLVGTRDESLVGDGHALGVAAQIREPRLGATAGRFCVDPPVLSAQWPPPGSEDVRLRAQGQIPSEAELTGWEGRLETGDELAAKNAAAHPAGKKEPVVGFNPKGGLERPPPGGHDTRDRRVKLELWVPGMQPAEKADLGTALPGIAGDCEKCFGPGPEQPTLDDLGVR